MKNLLWMATLALTAAALTACSNEEEPTINEDPVQKGNVVFLTATIQPQSVVTRSLLTENGDGSVTSEWQVGNRLLVGYQTNSDPNYAMATVKAIDPGTKAATVTLEMTDPKNGGAIEFYYPYDAMTGAKDLFSDQKGTLADIADNWVVCGGSATMSTAGSTASLTGTVTMAPLSSIWKFSFTDGSSGITNSINQLNISWGSRTYQVMPTNQSNIYVSMSTPSISTPSDIIIVAHTTSDVYLKTQTDISLISGKMYVSPNLALTRAKTMTEATASDIGRVIGQDGRIYDNGTLATACGTTAKAMIAYVGAVSGICDHGLAIALENESGGRKDIDGALAACASKTPIAGHSWRLPSSQDWQHMMRGCGSTDALIPDASLNNTSEFECLNFVTKVKAVGTKLDEDTEFGHTYGEYWATSSNGGWMMRIYLSKGTYTGCTGQCTVRACLPF